MYFGHREKREKELNAIIVRSLEEQLRESREEVEELRGLLDAAEDHLVSSMN